MILSARVSGVLLVAVACVVVGVAVGRPELIAIVSPVLLIGAWASLTRSRRAVGVEVEGATSEEAGIVTAQALIRTDGEESVLLRASAPGYRSRTVRIAGGDRTVGLRATVLRTGVHELFRADAIAESPGGVFVTPPTVAGPLRVAIQPRRVPLRGIPLPFRLPGLTGTHTSRRIGDGFDVNDVHEFSAGDRLRRVDWRTSARRAYDPRTGRLTSLYARRTFATADATVMIIVDSRDDVAQDVGSWASGDEVPNDEYTSLDVAREAAASIAGAYLSGGDRVGLDDLGRRRHPVPPGAGQRHGTRILHRLIRVAPEGHARERRRAPQVPSGALVVLCSTFLDASPAELASDWRVHGHRVVAVSTLPTLRTDGLDPAQQTALRFVLLARRIRLRELARRGVDVVDWNADSALALDALARTRVRGGGR